MIATSHIEVRNVDGAWEVPFNVWPGMQTKLDRSWVWVAHREGHKPEAVLVGAPAHGLVILLRIWKQPGAPSTLVRRLLQQTAQDCIQRGLKGWMCMLDGSRKEELKLAKLSLRFGAQHQPHVGLLAFGKLEDVCQK